MDNKKSNFQIPNWGWLVLSFLAAMALWFFLSVNPQTARSFPFIPEIIKALQTVIERGVLAEDFISSMISVVLGFAFGFITAVPIAFLMAWYVPVRNILEPWIQFIRNIPPLAYVPLIVIAAGVGRKPQVIVIWLATFLIMTVTIYQGVRNVDETLIKAARVLGAKDAICLGNLKYAGLPIPIDEQKRADIIEQIGGRSLWLVSSTHNDEEFKIGKYLKNLQDKHNGLLTLIAPRHPHRGTEIRDKLRDEYNLNVSLRSLGEKITDKTDVYIADTIGEMGIWYDISPIVFIGGSLIPHGGQNFMEPSRCRDAVVVGPHMHNFTDAMNRAKKADGIIQVNDTIELIDMIDQLLTNKDLLEAKRSLAYNWAMGEAKVLDGIVEKIQGYMDNENT